MEYATEVVRLKQVVCESSLPILTVGSSFQLGQWLEDEIGNESQEVLVLVCLNTKNKIISYSVVARGALNQSIAHPRDIFQRALLSNSARIIVAHNHPSGVLEPSKNDITFTERVKNAGEILGIELLDHLIVSENSYYSFREENML